MTRTEIKALIEPTQDGAKFKAHHIQTDPLMLTLQEAIDSAEDINDLSDKIGYAMAQLARANIAIQGLENSILEGTTE